MEHKAVAAHSWCLSSVSWWVWSIIRMQGFFNLCARLKLFFICRLMVLFIRTVRITTHLLHVVYPIMHCIRLICCSSSQPMGLLAPSPLHNTPSLAQDHSLLPLLVVRFSTYFICHSLFWFSHVPPVDYFHSLGWARHGCFPSAPTFLTAWRVCSFAHSGCPNVCFLVETCAQFMHKTSRFYWAGTDLVIGVSEWSVGVFICVCIVGSHRNIFTCSQ